MSTVEITLVVVVAALLAVVALEARRATHLTRRATEAEDRLRISEQGGQAANQSRARLEAALRAADIGVLLTDAAGEVAFANPAALPYLSGQPGEAVVENGVGRAVADALDRGEAQSRELELYVPRRRVVRLEASPLTGEEGRRLGAVAFVADVSEERRVEAMRRDFVAAAGHELKTPLGALSLLAETLTARVGDPDAAAHLAERIQSEAERLARLVDDMLDLSRVEESIAIRDPVPVADLMVEVADDAHSEAMRRGVEIVVEESPPGLSVPGDRRQLRAMLANLVGNAVKYCEPRPDRPPPRVWLRARDEGEWLQFEVEDEGIGIPEGHLGRIFERFYRVDRARSRTTGGTGLGLAIVRHVALNHGGEVGVESRLGEGSRFRVRLPKPREP